MFFFSHNIIIIIIYLPWLAITQFLAKIWLLAYAARFESVIIIVIIIIIIIDIRRLVDSTPALADHVHVQCMWDTLLRSRPNCFENPRIYRTLHGCKVRTSKTQLHYRSTWFYM